jgi:hypothetical protein
MKSVINFIAIIASLYSLYYQFIFFIFNNLTRSSKTNYSSSFFIDGLPEIITIIICLLFLIINIKALFKHIKSK